mgnify:CR=1 FL=1
MKARITVTLKSGVLDPQGKAIEGALKSLGIAGVAGVRQGKVFDIELDSADTTGAEALLKEAGNKNRYDARGVNLGGPCPYLPGNGGLLYAVAMMAAYARRQTLQGAK